MVLASICALSKNRVIGKDGTLPWRLKGDLAYFRQKTLGKVVIMGRSTYDSIGRPLPGRRIAVLSRRSILPPILTADAEVRYFNDVEAILRHAAAEAEVMVAGGAAVYSLFMPLVTVQYLTEIDARIEGDTFYPHWEPDQWQETSRYPGPPDSLPYSFVTYLRQMPAGQP